MRFSCDECGRSYVAADDVSGRAFRMRCKSCGHSIVVRPAAPSQDRAATHDTSLDVPKPPPARPAFDPFEGQDLDGSDSVAPEALEILDRTPPAVRLPASPGARASPPASNLPAPGRQPGAATPPPSPAARAATPTRGRAVRMLPAEDEKMLGPPGQEDRRGVRRWVVAAVLAGIAAAAGVLLRR